MSESNRNNIFRGNSDCPAVSSINSVEGLDIAKLHEKHEGAPGETANYTFPVRAQLTWFRAKNVAGLVETEILFEDPFRAQVKATIYDDSGKKLSSGHGTANIQDDDRFANKLVETAESRAVSRALDIAGFGCQLSAKTYDETDSESPENPSQPDGAVKDDGMPAMPGEIPIPAKTPDRINGSKIVDANSSAQPYDISELQAEDAAGKGEMSKPDKPDKLSAADQSTSATEETSEVKDGEITLTTDNSKETDTEKTNDDAAAVILSENGTLEEHNNAADGSQNSDPEGKPVVEIMCEAIQHMDAIQPDQFDRDYFGDGPVDPEALYINRSGKPTRIRNEDLQKAIIFFSEHQNMIQDVVFAAKNPEVNGKTIREIVAMGEYGESALFTWAFAYRGDLLALQAATLVYYQNNPALWRWEQKKPA
jgi:hypothetical protein